MKPEILCEQEEAILYDLEHTDYETWHSLLVTKLEKGSKHD